MKNITNKIYLITLILIVSGFESRSCTTFCIKDSKHLVFGRNLDFYTGIGHVVVNKRRVIKQSFGLPAEKPLTWTSKYGSITFNQMGREFPYGGINEKGLVIEQMWLDETQYPEADSRYGLTELQWIQYQLDNASSVHEVLRSDSKIRISKISAPLHFLICDSKGNTATVEYLNGKMVSHTQSTLPVCALANDTYDRSNKYISSLSNFKERPSNSFTSASFDRFAKAAMVVQKFSTQNVIDYSFDILEGVSQKGFTRWSIVYDIKNMTVYYKTQGNRAARKLEVSDFDFSCGTPSLYIDIDETMQSAKTSFKTYSYRENRQLVYKALDILEKENFMKELIPKDAEKERIAKYPESTRCNK